MFIKTAVLNVYLLFSSRRDKWQRLLYLQDDIWSFKIMSSSFQLTWLRLRYNKQKLLIISLFAPKNKKNPKKQFYSEACLSTVADQASAFIPRPCHCEIQTSSLEVVKHRTKHLLHLRETRINRRSFSLSVSLFVFPTLPILFCDKIIEANP